MSGRPRNDGESQVIIEVVDPAPGDAEEIESWVRLTGDDDARTASRYLSADQVIPSMSGARVIDEEVTHTVGYVETYVLRLFPSAAGRPPALLLRPIRIVVTANLLAVGWHADGWHPDRPPNAEELLLEMTRDLDERMAGFMDVAPSRPIQEAVGQGLPEHVAEFNHGAFGASLSSITDRLELPREDGQMLAAAESVVARIAANHHSIAHELSEAVNLWERDFLRTVLPTNTAQIDRSPAEASSRLKELAVLGQIVGTVGNIVTLLDDPWSHEPLHWFQATGDSPDIGRYISEAESKVDEARDDIRIAVTFSASAAASASLEAQRRSARQANQFQRAVALVGALALAPAVVAGIYGASIELPGEDTWWGTLIVLGLSSALGVLIWSVLRVRPKDEER